ncbi:MAG TPA: competence protein ComA [Deltaproteobacteria bacterium]|nr:competence protein ComA [Deltaproteobacteria bacterium]
MIEKSLKLSVAESCTGGLIASRITDIAGSSEYFDAGMVTYSNAAKIRFLGVPEELLIRHGAVSRETAESMAQGVRRATGSHVGLSVTGIAGPGGGSDLKPVGTVFIGISWEEGVLVKGFLFKGDRKEIRQQASDAALQMVIDHLEVESV